MSTELGKRLFTFAVVTDTHVNFDETECNSEFEINKRANGRLRHVVRDLNRQDLAFVMHLGDVVHPVPALTDLYEQAAARFQEVAAELRHPLYLAPGNHDIGDKPIVWGPGGVVREEFIELWNKNFGPNYQAFEHGDCRFYLVDAQIINSGLAHEAEQKAWLEADLAEAAGAGKRLFLGTHYPPFLTEAGEDEHFDNIAEPGRSWLLNLLERHGAEALFSGHVHNFWYNRHGVTGHMISHGFTPVDRDQIIRLSGLDGVHGVVFRVDGRTSPWQAAHEAVALCREGDLKASLHIRMTRGNPGDVQGDDAWAAHRIAEALAAAAAHGDVHVYPDTFDDVDRGYFRRHGVVDRFFNPRPACHVVRHLNAALATGLGARNKMVPVADERCVAFGDADGRRYRLLAGDGLPELDGRPEKDTLIDLLSGERLGAGPAPGDYIGTTRSATLSLWISET